MTELTTIGNVLLNESLPESYRQHVHALDKSGIHKLLNRMARENPDEYKPALQRMLSLGKTIGFDEGVTVTVSGLKSSAAKHKNLQPVRQKLEAILNHPGLDREQRNKAVVDLLMPAGESLQNDLLDEAKAENNPYALQIQSGARGKKGDLNSLRGADLLTADAAGKIIPLPLMKSFGEGLDPAEYFAGTFNQRANAIATKMATADAGYLSKRLIGASHRRVVTGEKPVDTRLPVGLPTTTSDKDNVGAVLAQAVGDLQPGTILTSANLARLKEKGVEDILVHSPLTDLTEDGGLSRWSAGQRDRRGLSLVGDNIGIAAAQAVGEKVSQGMLSCLAAGTLVRMVDGSTKPIESMVVGDLVLGVDAATGWARPVKVTRTYDQGQQPVYRFSFRQAHARVAADRLVHLESTTEHKVLGHHYFSSADGETHRQTIMPVGKLNKISGVVMHSGTCDAHQVYDWRAKILGALLGDGCYTKSVCTINLTCADKSQIDDLNEYLRPYGMQLTLKSGHTIYYLLAPIDGPHHAHDPITKQVVTANPIKRWLQDLGAYGKYAHEKAIPAQFLWTWNNRAVSELIAGLWVTDGSVVFSKDGPRLTFGSTSLTLIEQVDLLLRTRFGIYGAVSRGTMSGRKRKLYSYSIAKYRDIRKFSQVIELFGVKRDRLARAAREAPVCRTDPEWFRRHTTEYLGDLPTYDIEVDHPDHLFVLANGLVVSNSKHNTAAAKAAQRRSGFAYINNLVEAPDKMPGAGPLAEEDGMVKSIRPAPQGGNYVQVGDREYYLHQDLTPTVKQGDRLEQGDDLSDGVPHPRDLVRLRGIGEARRTYVNLLREGLDASGISSNRRNLEVIASGLLDWAKVTGAEGIGDHVPDDIVRYSSLAAQYKPRSTAKLLAPKSAIGKYLEEPVLHLTPGTRLTSKMAAELGKWKIKDVTVHDDPPDFEPHMERGITGLAHDPDWQVRMGGFYTGKSFQDALHRGLSSDTNSTSFIPALAEGKGFGDNLSQTGHYGGRPLDPRPLPPPAGQPSIQH